MTGPRVAIIQLVDPEGKVSVEYANNVFDFACEMLAEGCAVSTTPWQGTNIDELLLGLHDADRILLWDPDVTVDLAATKLALDGKTILEALDEADVMTAPVLRDEQSMTVFSGSEVFAVAGDALGAALSKEMAEKRLPVVFGGCGCYWMWLHVAAISRLTEPPERPHYVAGIDVTLSRRFIMGGCTAKVDPRISVRSHWQSSAQWALEPVEELVAEGAAAPEVPAGE